MKHLGTVELETTRLRLRPFDKNDAKDMFNNWASNTNVTKFLTWPTHSSEEGTRQLLDIWKKEYSNEEFYQWAIEYKEIKQVVGSISVVSINENINAVEIGYCIGEAFWNKGITTEALETVIKFLFEEVQCNCICARHDVNNPSSGKVMKKCGLQFEGIQLQAARNNMGICDLATYAIIKEQYQ
jgi:RimJ/RimL family protein N-acetyltransferase